MYSLSTTYEFELPNGRKICFGDDEGADNWQGYITDITTDVDIVTSEDKLGQSDGSLTGDSWLGKRSVTFDILLHDYDVANLTSRLEKIARLNLLLRGGGTLRWTEANGNRKQVQNVKTAQYISNKADIMRRDLQLQFIIGDPYIYSQELYSPDPWDTDTIVTTWNSGIARSWPVIWVNGPCTSFQLENNDTGEVINYQGTLDDAADYVYIDTHPARRQILRNGITNVYNNLDWETTTFFGIDPGGSKIQLTAAGDTSDTQFRLAWRSAWL